MKYINIVIPLNFALTGYQQLIKLIMNTNGNREKEKMKKLFSFFFDNKTIIYNSIYKFDLSHRIYLVKYIFISYSYILIIFNKFCLNNMNFYITWTLLF